MTDTHTHLYFPEDYGGTDGFSGNDVSRLPTAESCAAVERALEAGVGKMIFPNVNNASVEPLLALHHAYPEQTFTAPGLHPSDAGADWREEVREIFDRFSDEHPVAIGEIGIDLYHDATWRTRQMDAFGHQLQIAVERQLPVIIHCREGLDETLEILRSFGDGRPATVFHSFTYGPAEARRILEEVPEAKFGINGVATFRNAPAVREAIRTIGIDRIVLETDSPYLAPVPYRGRRNESSYLPSVCATVAQECGISSEEAERITDQNAARLFNI